MELNGLPLTVMSSHAVTLTFDLLTRKPNQYASRPKKRQINPQPHRGITLNKIV